MSPSLSPSLFPLLLTLLLTPFLQLHSSPISLSHFTKPHPHNTHTHTTTPPQEYQELTHPLPTSHLSPSCSFSILHTFSNTINKPPFSIPYSPPPPNCSFSHTTLNFHASSHGDQYDRIAALWLSGIELLRTSTAEPTPTGIFWNIQKDISKYTSILTQQNLTLSVMLENIVNDVFTGSYHVNITFICYQTNPLQLPANHLKLNRKLGTSINNTILHHKSVKSLYEKPADVIVPVSGVGDQGFWFRIENENDVHKKDIRIPLNTYRAVLEIYASSHGNDEFWYSNPPDSYIEKNGLVSDRGHGAYREVFVTIDGNVVASVIPFPVIFTGGINPLFWEPIVGIGAFEVPSYDFDLTPFLGMVLDGKSHSFGIGVSESISFWLVNANLHLWVDHDLGEVEGEVVEYHYPPLAVDRINEFEFLDGTFKIKAERKSQFVGRVRSTLGSFTTYISQELKFENLIRFYNNGNVKTVKHKVRTITETKVKNDEGFVIIETIVKRKYPLKVEISNMPGSGNDTSMMFTKVSHGLRDKYKSGDFSRSLHNKQNSTGWMQVKDHSVLSGEAVTDQYYRYIDEFGCYSRLVKASNAVLVIDETSYSCSPPF